MSSDDIVERLRYRPAQRLDAHYLAADALAEIVRLRAEVEQLADELMHTPDEWAPLVLAEGPHDHKGYSEEKCTRCGWVMGNKPLNCNNDDTPHVFPSQLAEVGGPHDNKGYTEEIVARLRYYDEYNDHAPPSFCGRVADHIATLTADLAKKRSKVQQLRAAGYALAEAHYYDGVCFGCGCDWDDNGTPACVNAGRPCPPRRPERTVAVLIAWKEACDEQ